jgi:RHS repeat-associated protein
MLSRLCILNISSILFHTIRQQFVTLIAGSRSLIAALRDGIKEVRVIQRAPRSSVPTRFAVGNGRRAASLLLVLIMAANPVLATPGAGAQLLLIGSQSAKSAWSAWRESGLYRRYSRARYGSARGQAPKGWDGKGAPRRPKPPTIVPETKGDRERKVAGVKIFPGDVTIDTGETVMLSAIAIDKDGRAIGGLDIKWEGFDEGNKRDIIVSQTARFSSSIPGKFKLTAEITGRKASVRVTVVGVERKPNVRSETEEPVSSTDKPKDRRASLGPVNTPRDAAPRKNRALNTAQALRAANSPVARTAAVFLQGEDDYGWNSGNYTTIDDAGKERGNIPGHTPDGGVGSGNFQFSAPLFGLEGRGVDLNLAFNYNSRLWHKSGTDMYFDVDRDWIAGWMFGFGKIVMAGTSYIMIEPDGTRHPYSGVYRGSFPSPFSSLQSYEAFTTDGSFINYYAEGYKGQFDNSFGHNMLSAWARLPNGTKIEYGARANYAIYPIRITDANGNYITITYRTYTRSWDNQTYDNVQEGPYIETITDTLGRVIQFHYERQGEAPNEKDLLTAVTAPGMGEEPRRVILRIQYDTKDLSSAGGNYGFQAGLTPRVRDNGVISVVKAIYYPATSTGYWFGDDDSYSPYGMIRKVSERRAMTCTVGGVACGLDENHAPLTEQPSLDAGLISREAIYNHPSQPGYSYPHISGALTDTPTYTEMTEEWAGRATPTPPVTKYSVADIASIKRTTIVRPDGVRIEQDINNTSGSIYNGLLVEDRTYPDEFSSTVIHRSTVSWYRDNPSNDATNLFPSYCSPRPTRTEVYDDRGQMTATEYGYGPSYNQVQNKTEYGYGGFNRLHRVYTEYQNDISYRGTWINRGTLVSDGGTSPSWSGPHLFNLVLEQSIYAPDDVTRVAHVRTRYDELGLVTRSGAGQLDGAPAQRGNVTTIKRYANAASLDEATAVLETRFYDNCGNVITLASSCCEQTRYEYNVDSQYAWPTVIRRGSQGNPDSQNVVDFGIDFNTGLVMNSHDANGRFSETFCSAALRPLYEYNGSGGYAYHIYDDDNLVVYDFTYEQDYSGPDFASRSDKYIDGHGRVHGEIAYGKDYVLDYMSTQYDNLGRLWQQSRPYRASPEYTVYEYDSLDRQKKVTAPDGSVGERFYNESNEPSMATGDPGQTVRAKDPWGRERWARFDSQNRLAEVIEPDASGNGSVATNGFRTQYFYDTLGNLTQIMQLNQVRSFKYDGLSRLTHQKLAERDATLNDAGVFVATRHPSLPQYSGGQWSDVFFYDNRSNLIQRVDARGVMTVLDYENDPLNRVQSISYNKSGAPANLQSDFPIPDAPSISYTYPTTGDKTRLQAVNTSTGMGNQTFSYLSNGLPSGVVQTFPGKESNPVSKSYIWDTLDRLKSLQYPMQYGTSTNAPLVEPSYDIASRISHLYFDGTPYASDPVYNAESQIESLNIGSLKSEEYTYDPKTGLLLSQQVKQGSAIDLSLAYNYTLNFDPSNNGPKTGQLTKVFDPSTSYFNRFNYYDALGRLKETRAGSDSANPVWKQTYSYDRYGNRFAVAKSGPGSASIPLDGLASLSYSNVAGQTINNRITTNGYEYDPTGNQTRGQTQNGTWMRYRYDSAGRLVDVRNDSNVSVESYSYGASNQRLKTDFAGGGAAPSIHYAWEGGQVIAEYRANNFASTLGWDKYYVYLGGRLLATSELTGGTKYYHPDRLGTRIVSDASSGSITTSQTNLPYGTALETSGTSLARRFTSYDRSVNSGMDYAVNRFYNSAQGRFTQVDPIDMDAASLSDPQSLNLYAYCGNDPINWIDPDGLFFGKLFNAIGSFIKKVAKVFAVVLAVVAVLAFSWGFGAIGWAALAGAGIFALIGWGSGKLAQLAAGVAFPIGGGGFRTPSTFPGGAGVGGVSNFLASDPLEQSIWDSRIATDALQTITDFFSGFGDSLTFGITDAIREGMGTNRSVNKCGGAYKAGEYVEVGGEVLATGGSALLKSAAKSVARSQVRREAARMTSGIARNGKELHHINPLFGHPGGAPTLFPTGGLPASIHSGKWNLRLLGHDAHAAAHRRLRIAENIGKGVVNPGLTTGRAAAAGLRCN